MSGNPEQAAVLHEVPKFASESPRPIFVVKRIITGKGLYISIACKQFTADYSSRIKPSSGQSSHEMENARHLPRQESATQKKLFEYVYGVSASIIGVCVAPLVDAENSILVHFDRHEDEGLALIEIAEDIIRQIVIATDPYGTGLADVLMTFEDFRISNCPIVFKRTPESLIDAIVPSSSSASVMVN